MSKTRKPQNGPEHRPESDYEIGRGKPPMHTRFKPGQSGNPKGRPKGVQVQDRRPSHAQDPGEGYA